MPPQEPSIAADLPDHPPARESAAANVLGRMLHGFMTVASLTLVAKTVSFFKEAAVASRFGIGDDLDAFILAFTLLSFFSTMLGGGLPSAFIPVFSRLNHRSGPEGAHRLAAQMALCSLVTFVIVGHLLGLVADPLVRLMSRGFSAGKQAESAHILRLLLPFFIGSGMTLHLAAWLQAQKKFVLPAICPAVAPAVIIGALVASGPHASIEVLVRATNLGIVLQVLVLSLAVRRTLPRRRGWFTGVLRRWEPDSFEVLRNMLPFMLAGIAIGSAPVIDQVMASWLAPGSVAILGYSERITSILLALSAAPAGEALFPYFADAVARREWRQLRRHLHQVTGAILAAAIPMTILMAWFAPLIVRILFQRGEFTADDTERVASVLRFSVFQVPFYIASSLASRLTISMQASRFTLALTACSLAINVVCNLILMGPLGIAGIALSTVFVHFFAAVAFHSFALHRINRHLAEEAAP